MSYHNKYCQKQNLKLSGSQLTCDIKFTYASHKRESTYKDDDTFPIHVSSDSIGGEVGKVPQSTNMPFLST